MFFGKIIGKPNGPIFGPKIGLGKSLQSVTFIKIFSMTRVNRKTFIFFLRKKLWQTGYTVIHATGSQEMAVSSTSQDVDISSV